MKLENIKEEKNKKTTHYKVEPILAEEKETFIHIYNCETSVEITTTDHKVYNRLVKKLGEAHQVFSPTHEHYLEDASYISGASWKYDYFDDRDKLKQIFSLTNLLPRKKDNTD